MKKIPKMPKRTVFRPSEVSVPTDYSLEEIGTTQTLCQAFMCCRMRWLLMLNRWRHASKTQTTFFGSVVHDLLDRLHSSGSADESDPQHMIDSILNERQDEFVGVDAEQLELESALAVITCSEYVRYYSKDWAEKKFDSTEQEVSFEFAGVKFHVKIDGRYIDKNGKRWQMEHKTKGRIEIDSLLKHLPIDFQNLLYLFAGEAHYKEQVSGVLYNIIRKCQLQQGKQSMSQYLDRVRADMRERPDFYFMRFEVPYTKLDKLRFSWDLSAMLNDMKSVTAGPSGVYKNPAACQSPYKCEFMEACASDDLASYFQAQKLFSELENVDY